MTISDMGVQANPFMLWECEYSMPGDMIPGELTKELFISVVCDAA